MSTADVDMIGDENVMLQNERKRIHTDENNPDGQPILKHRRQRIGTNPARQFNFSQYDVKPEEGEQEKHRLAGQIVSLEMENFMNHSNLKFELDVDRANVVFIGGPNGSGKSAVLAALNIGLGGKGSLNDRGNSLANYVKEGTSRAKVRTGLSNEGQGRIPDYGPRIEIERSFGTSTAYVVKNITGHGRDRKEEIVSRKKKDVDKIVTRFGIQLANPIHWMTQDRCRQFLQDMKPEKLYQIFVLSTGLEETSETYEKVEILLHSTYAQLEDVKDKQMATEEDIRQLEEYEQKHHALLVQREKLEKMSWFLLWAPVKKAHRLKELAVVKLKQIDRTINDIKQRVLETVEKINQVKKDNAEDLSRVDAVQKQVAELRDRLADTKARKRHCHGVIDQLKRKKKEFTDDIRMKEMNVRRVYQKLEESRKNDGSDKIGRQLTELRQKKQDVSKELSEEERKLSHLDAERKNASAEEREAKAGYLKARNSMQDIQRRIETLKQQQFVLQRSASDELLKYGPCTKRILDAIERYASRFTRKPVGPLGRYVNLLDEKWAYPVDKALQKNLCAFIVDNVQDDKLLKQIVKQIDSKCVINTFVSKFAPRYDITTQEPITSRDWTTIARVVEVTDDNVFNTLVDICNIDNVLLMENDAQARRIMDGNCPARAQMCYTLSGAQLYGSNQSGGFYRCYGDNSDKVTRYIHKTSSSRSQQVDTLLEQLEQDKTALVHESRRLSKEHESADFRCKHAARELTNTQSNIQRLKEETLRELIRQIEKLEDMPSNLEQQNTFQSTIDALEADIRSLKEDLEPLDEQLAEELAEEEEVAATLTGLDEERERMEKQLIPSQTRMANVTHKIEKLQKNILQYEENEQRLDETKKEAEEERIRFSHEYDLESEKARDLSVHLVTPAGQSVPPDLDKLPDPDRLQAQFKELDTAIQAQERNLPPLEQIQEQLKKASEHYEEGLETEKRHIEFYEALEAGLRIRKEKFPIVRHAIIYRLKNTFSRLMNYRGITGRIDVDIQRKSIDIRVSTHRKDKQGNSHQAVMQDLKGLSGGERSYTTACFIMSLWECMESPFKCMDEFDVFMDMCNRKIVMDLIVKSATTEYAHTQFLLFTPQGIKELKTDARVQVFEMPKVRDLPTSG